MPNLIRLSVIIIVTALFSCNSSNDNSQTSAITKPVENIVATKEQQDRRKQSENYCMTHNVPVYKNPNAMFMDVEDSITLQTKDAVVDRALALCYIGLKSEGLEQQYLDEMDKNYNISPKLSPNEKEYAIAKHPTGQQRTDANWRYESLHVMLWALSFIDSLNYPDKVCNVADDVKIINSLSEQEFRQKAKLRTKKEILDQADLILRLDWACVEARINNKEAPGKLDKDVVSERHYSLNWLINLLNEDWDNVSTDT